MAEIEKKDYCFYPIRHLELYKLYKKQQAVIWNPEEINFSSDREDWEQLDSNTKTFLKQILGFFACSDGIIISNIIDNFKIETSFIKEAQAFYCVQNFIESVHAETYSQFIDVFFRDSDPEKQILFESATKMPFVKNVANWMFKWMENKSLPLSDRVVAFSCIEGIFFCSAFAAIYWLKSKNVLKGLLKSNEFICRDEMLHVEFSCQLYKIIIAKENNSTISKESRAIDIIKEAVEVAEEFTRNSLQLNLIGIDTPRMCLYIKSTADILCEKLNIPKIYNITHEFPWALAIGISNVSNFFETTISEYSVVEKREKIFDFLNTNKSNFSF